MDMQNLVFKALGYYNPQTLEYTKSMLIWSFNRKYMGARVEAKGWEQEQASCTRLPKCPAAICSQVRTETVGVVV